MPAYITCHIVQPQQEAFQKYLHKHFPSKHLSTICARLKNRRKKKRPNLTDNDNGEASLICLNPASFAFDPPLQKIKKISHLHLQQGPTAL